MTHAAPAEKSQDSWVYNIASHSINLASLLEFPAIIITKSTCTTAFFKCARTPTQFLCIFSPTLASAVVEMVLTHTQYCTATLVFYLLYPKYLLQLCTTTFQCYFQIRAVLRAWFIWAMVKMVSHSVTEVCFTLHLWEWNKRSVTLWRTSQKRTCKEEDNYNYHLSLLKIFLYFWIFVQTPSRGTAPRYLSTGQRLSIAPLHETAVTIIKNNHT